MSTPQEFNARRAAIATQISAVSGCSLDLAELAAGSYLAFPADHQFGLGYPPVGKAMDYIQAGAALSAWLRQQPQLGRAA